MTKFWLLLLFSFLYDFSKSNCDTTRHVPQDPDMFSELKLNVEELHGSRWAIEQKDMIDVSHSVDIVDATLVQQAELTLRVEFNLRQSWHAKSLAFPEGLFKDSDPDSTYVTSGDQVLKYMWSPDSYISTTRASNMYTVGMPVSLVYIFKNRTIIYKVRMFTSISCTAGFQWYPLDTQTCDLIIESYKYHDDVVNYFWTDEKLYRPVNVNISRLFQYELQMPPKFDNGSIVRGGRGMGYSFVRVRFHFDRKLGNNLIQVYAPTILVVVLSWFSFWLGLDAIPGRITLLITCMLTLITMQSGIKMMLPPVSYCTMMDLWMICCISMVFGGMLEFVLVNYMHWKVQLKEKQRKALDKASQVPNSGASFLDRLSAPRGKTTVKDAMMEAEAQMLNTILTNENRNLELQQMETSQLAPVQVKSVPAWVKVDRVSRVVFPLLFCAFNAMYWPILILGNEQRTSDLENV